MPNVKAAFDAWSPTLEGLSPEEIKAAILKMKPFIVHTSTADYVRLPRYQYDIALINYKQQESLIRAVPMGEGIIDYETFFDTLREMLVSCSLSNFR